MSNNPELNPNQPRDLPQEKWTHLNQYERKYLQEVIQAYDEIMQLTDDVPRIAISYQLTADEVQRAKNYAFGTGVSEHEFIPDEDMAAAWKRMESGQGTDIDEVLLMHEVFESDLVVNQAMNQKEAHNLAQQRYPWSELLKQQDNQ